MHKQSHQTTSAILAILFGALLFCTAISATLAASTPKKTPPPLPSAMSALNSKLQASKVVDLTYYQANAKNGAAFNQEPLNQLSLNELIVPAVVINVQNQVNQHTNYSVTTDDITSFEKANGHIPPNSIVIINTGWFKQHGDAKKYLGITKDKTKQFPSIGKAALQLLASRNITGIGIDAPDNSATSANTMLWRMQQSLYILYNLDNLDYLPITGSSLVIGILPSKQSIGLARVFAFLPS